MSYKICKKLECMKKTNNLKIPRLKYIMLFFAIILMSTFLYGCSTSSKTSSSVTTSLNQELRKKAKTYTNAQYQNGEVALKTYIKMEGKITQTDNKNKKVVAKDDRFILVNNGVRYQMICGQNTTVKVGSKVIIFGTYYGLVKVDEIEVK